MLQFEQIELLQWEAVHHNCWATELQSSCCSSWLEDICRLDWFLVFIRKLLNRILLLNLYYCCSVESAKLNFTMTCIQYLPHLAKYQYKFNGIINSNTVTGSAVLKPLGISTLISFSRIDGIILECNRNIIIWWRTVEFSKIISK